MKLIVDGQEKESQSGKTLVQVLEESTKEAKSRNRIIINIKIDRKEIPGAIGKDLLQKSVDEIEVLELGTAEPRKLSIEILYESARIMPRLADGLNQIAENIQAHEENKALTLLHDCLQSWIEINQGIKGASIALGLDFKDISIEETNLEKVQMEIQDFLDTASNALKKEDYLEFSDLLEYEISPRLRQVERGLYEMIKEAEKELN